MNVEHIPAEDVDMLPCGADWQSRHLESEKRKAEIRDRIHKQAEQGQKTAKDYFRPAKPTPSIYDSDLKRVAVYARVSPAASCPSPRSSMMKTGKAAIKIYCDMK